MARTSMSLESAMDEERLEVMNLLEGRPASYRSSSATPAPINTTLRYAPVRSMLDIDASAPPKSAPLTRSMLNPYSPLPRTSPLSLGASPTEAHRPGGGDLHRSSLDAAPYPQERRSLGNKDQGGLPYANNQFDMTSTVQGPGLPKRNTQGGKKGFGLSSMASIIQGQELEAPVRPRGRHNSTAGILGRHAKSPSSRLGNRSDSPGGALLNNNSFSLMPTPGKFVTDSGKVIDMNNAFRRLSDANLLKAGSKLSTAPSKNGAQLLAGESFSPGGGTRLHKDYYDDEEDAVAALVSSDENRSSDEESWGERGRRRRRKKISGADADNEESDNDVITPSFMPRPGGPRTAKSLLQAAENERIEVSSQHKVQSLIEPVVNIIGPGGERLAVKKAGVHPNTNYNSQISGQASPVTSDSEDLSDIRRAQRLSIHLSPVDSTIPHRVIRTIIRGEFSALQKEAEEGTRRLRTYLVATDLSGEAAYALEWTIGTVLRDGDTLLAVYAVDEEVGTGKTGDTDSIHSLPIGEGGQAMQETAALVGKMTAAAQSAPPTPVPSPLSALPLLSRNKDSRPGSSDSRHVSKGEQERNHAIEDISQTCIRFLRKTKLQVRIAVEVIHCKSPKHMITEAIDMLEPTLVILGSRGRSALKGVLLGSFSNYLVTKSSVPVMVARKKLQKPNAKNKLPHMRLANNLTPSRSLAEAKID